jgi:hypothetical protein
MHADGYNCLTPLFGTAGRANMIRKQTIEEKWREESKKVQGEALKLPPGKKRDALVRKARQLETASQIDEWLSSPGLQPPT